MQLYLAYHDGPYNLVTTITAFLTRSFFCKHCGIGNNDPKNISVLDPSVILALNLPVSHRRNSLSRYNDTSNAMNFIDFFFSNAECLGFHSQGDKFSVCKQYYRCRV